MPGPVALRGAGRGKGREYLYNEHAFDQARRAHTFLKRMTARDARLILFREGYAVPLKLLKQSLLSTVSPGNGLCDEQKLQVAEGIAEEITETRAKYGPERLIRNRLRDTEKFSEITHALISQFLVCSSDLSASATPIKQGEETIGQALVRALRHPNQPPKEMAEADEQSWGDAEATLSELFSGETPLATHLARSIREATADHLRQALADYKNLAQLARIEGLLEAHRGYSPFSLNHMIEDPNSPAAIRQSILTLLWFRKSMPENMDLVLAAINALSAKVGLNE